MRPSRPQAPAERRVGRLADRRLERATHSGTRASTGAARAIAGVLVLAVACVVGGTLDGPVRPARHTTPLPASQRDTAAPVPNDADGGTTPTAPPPTGVVLIQGAPQDGPTSGSATSAGQPVVPGFRSVAGNGIPVTVLAAYRHAVSILDATQPGCRIPVELLAGIGKVESGHAMGGRVDATGTALRPILGPVLDGANGTAAIHDTDGGALDGDPVWDRAVGPMQFIPSTWRRWQSDGNGDGRDDPENVYDAGLTAARYLCADGRDLATSAGIDAAILSYNDSQRYLRLVLAWLNAYRGSVVQVADITSLRPTSPIGPSPTSVPPPGGQPVLPTTTTKAGPVPTIVKGTGGTVAPPPPSTRQQPPPVTTTTTRPAPPPTTTAPPPPPDPVSGLLCGINGVLGGLLGLAPPPPGCPTGTG